MAEKEKENRNDELVKLEDLEPQEAKAEEVKGGFRLEIAGLDCT